MSDLLRVYFDPKDIGTDGYPFAWHLPIEPDLAIKHLVRDLAGNRCIRCGHPYEKGEGEWSPCDKLCTHGNPLRVKCYGEWTFPWSLADDFMAEGGIQHAVAEWPVEAQWRILTVHHLNRVKHDCRWWNLAALCQRCHLTIQGKVYLERRWRREHSEWFKPYAAGWYAWSFLGQELTREQTMARLDELLALEDRQLELA